MYLLSLANSKGHQQRLHPAPPNLASSADTDIKTSLIDERKAQRRYVMPNLTLAPGAGNPT
jgi:hypothetical protein